MRAPSYFAFPDAYRLDNSDDGRRALYHREGSGGLCDWGRFPKVLTSFGVYSCAVMADLSLPGQQGMEVQRPWFLSIH